MTSGIIKRMTDAGYEIRQTTRQQTHDSIAKSGGHETYTVYEPDKLHAYSWVGKTPIAYLQVRKDDEWLTIPAGERHITLQRLGETVQGRDLYQDYYQLSDNQMTMVEWHINDLRTIRYFSAILKNAGMVEYQEDEDPVKVENADSFSWYINGSAEIGMHDGRHIAQVLWMSLESLISARFYFDHAPTLDDFKAVWSVREARYKLWQPVAMNAPSELVYTCDYCGATRHWLDAPGSIEDKLSNMEMKHCGRC